MLRFIRLDMRGFFAEHFNDRLLGSMVERGEVESFILIAIWHILTDLKPYAPDGFLESRPVNESKVLTTSQALNLLKQRGYTIKDDAVTAS